MKRTDFSGLMLLQVIVYSIGSTIFTLIFNPLLEIITVIILITIFIILALTETRRNRYVINEFRSIKILSYAQSFGGQFVKKKRLPPSAGLIALTKRFYPHAQRQPQEFYQNTIEYKSWVYTNIAFDAAKFRGNTYGTALSVVAFELGRPLPNMLFISKSFPNSPFRLLLQPAQINHMDVSFDDYYTTYFPLDYHIDGRSVISPEVMLAMTQLQAVDFEISGDKLYAYSEPVDPTRIPELITSISTIHASLVDHVRNYRDERADATMDRQAVSEWAMTLRRKVFGASLESFALLALALQGLLYSPSLSADNYDISGWAMTVGATIVFLAIYVPLAIYSIISRLQAAHQEKQIMAEYLARTTTPAPRV